MLTTIAKSTEEDSLVDLCLKEWVIDVPGRAKECQSPDDELVLPGEVESIGRISDIRDQYRQNKI